MDKLKTLIARCKCGVYVYVNAHRDVYETAEQWFADQRIMSDSLNATSADVCLEMIRLDTVVDVQFYPNSPVGFFRVVHFDLDAALDAALACLDQVPINPATGAAHFTIQPEGWGAGWTAGTTAVLKDEGGT